MFFILGVLTFLRLYSRNPGLVALSTLKLQGNHLSSLESLPLLPGSTELDVSGNRLHSIAALSKAAPALDSLDLSRYKRLIMYRHDMMIEPSVMPSPLSKVIRTCTA